MNSPSSATTPTDALRPSTPPWSLIFAGLISVGVLALLIFVYPYAAGYGNTRTPLSVYLFRYWKLEDWQQCWLVVPACVAMVWMKRKELPYDHVCGHWSGGVILAFSFLLYYLGYLIDNYYFGFAAIQVFIGGTIVWFLGWNWLKELLFPLFFLVFAWPLLFLDTMVAFPLRMIMSDAAYHLMNFIGIASIKVGSAVVSAPVPELNIAQGQKFAVDIANPCSGIRSLYALMMVSSLYAYFMVRPKWKQITVFVCSIPLAILGNLGRIFMLIIGTLLFGANFAIGTLENPTWFHMAAGYVVFIIALGGLLLLSTILQMNWVKIFSHASRQVAASATAPAKSQEQKSTHQTDKDVY